MGKLIFFILITIIFGSETVIANTELVGPIPTEIQITDAEAITAETMGVHIHRIGQGTQWPEVKFGVWRLWDAYVAWPNIQPEQNVWNFKRLDMYVNKAQSEGVDIVLPLGLTPTWASSRPEEKSAYGLGNAAEPADMTTWDNYVERVVRRYSGRIKYYDIWNEINLTSFYSGDFKTMLELQMRAYKIIKAIDPAAKLIAPSITGNNLSEVRKLGEYLKLGGGKYADIVSYHFYTPKSHPEAIFPLAQAVKTQVSEAGFATLPVWNTESGYLIDSDIAAPTADATVNKQWLRLNEEEGTAYTIIAVIAAVQSGITKSFFYSWDNDLFGVVGRDGKNETLMRRQWEWFNQWFIGWIPNGCSLSDSVSQCLFVNAKSSKMKIIWRSPQSGTSPSVSYLMEKGEMFRDLCRDSEWNQYVENLALDSVCPVAIVETIK